jgi:SHS2 domain-containing protein
LAEAGRALSKLLLRGVPATPDDRSREIVVSSTDREALLVDWLNEILYVAETERWVPVQFDIAEVSETFVRACSRGVPVPEAPAVVKATTHHGLRVKEVDEAIVAEVIFDV